MECNEVFIEGRSSAFEAESATVLDHPIYTVPAP